ncbi:MAG TPA: hypothetical protein EYP58_03355 [bacterium (Candidatus Stahlbacteria)]|nr:hypothetical protein [Candidatus Stahlbacteria bacterium]
MKKVLAIILLATLPLSAQLLWRGAKTMKQGSFIGMVGLYYKDLVKSYNWTDEEWQEISGSSYLEIGGNLMVGYGVLDNLEFLVHIPVVMKDYDVQGTSSSSSGIGDVFPKLRFMAIRGGKEMPVFLTFLAAARFPTGDKDASPALGDGTIDIGGGFLLMTRKMNKFKFHVKGAYWYNGKTDSDVDIGDCVIGIGKIDYHVAPKVMPFLNFTGKYFFAKRDSAGNEVANSEKQRFEVIPGLVWKPIKGLSIRPKVKFPIPTPALNKGGKLYTFMPGLDIWYAFKP